MRWVVAKAETKKQDDTMVEFRVAMMSTCTPTKGQYSTPRPRQTCPDSGRHIRSPLPNRSPLLVPFRQSCIYMVRKKHSGEADQLTLASGGSEHEYLFSVATRWGNKMNFNLHANMAGFCSISHTCIDHFVTCFTSLSEKQKTVMKSTTFLQDF